MVTRLLLPILLFSGAYFSATMTFSALTGFYLEAVAGETLDGSNRSIENLERHFLSDYEARLTSWGLRQYVLNLSAILVVVFWFLGNFLAEQKEVRSAIKNET